MSYDTNYTIKAQTLVTLDRPFSRFPPYLHALAMRFRIDGIEVMSHVFSGSKQVIKFAKVAR